MLKARNIEVIQFSSSMINDFELISKLRSDILHGDLIVIKNVYDKKIVNKIKEYLIGIGRYSIPNYSEIIDSAPNFHRINNWDNRSFVKGCFHQFTFFPWNQDIFNLFELTKEIYYLKNLINKQPKDKFLGVTSEDGCVSRLSFQFYPKAIGGLNMHSDPVDLHQLTVPILIMSKKGIDFSTGGLYVQKIDEQLIYCDDFADIGDVIFFNAQIPHGVDIIDQGKENDWLSFEGRWMMIFATNKINNNNNIANAIQLDGDKR